MNWGLIISFTVVTVLGLAFLYLLIRPWTHKEHKHEEYHPPHLD